MATMIKVFRVASPSPSGLTTALEEFVNPWLRKLPGDAQVQTATMLFQTPATGHEQAQFHLVATLTVTAAALPDGL